MTVGLVQDMSSPNVTLGYLVPEFDVWNLQYATLTDKAADDFSTVPGLAESWEASDDGLTYTYPSARGCNGPTANRSPPTTSPTRSTAHGTRQWSNHYSTTVNLDATAIDDRTVQIMSSVPDPKLPTMDVYIVPKHIYETLDADTILEYDALDGVASGPYSLTDWRSGQDWTMVKNPNWWGRDNGIDRIVFRVFTNPDAMVAALQQGEIDFAHDIPYSSVDLLEGRGRHRGRRRPAGRLHRARAQRYGGRHRRRSPGTAGHQRPPRDLLRDRPRRAVRPRRARPRRQGHDDVAVGRLRAGCPTSATSSTHTIPPEPTRSSTMPATSTPTATACARCPTAAARSSSGTPSAPSRRSRRRSASSSPSGCATSASPPSSR